MKHAISRDLHFTARSDRIARKCRDRTQALADGAGSKRSVNCSLDRSWDKLEYVGQITRDEIAIH